MLCAVAMTTRYQLDNLHANGSARPNLASVRQDLVAIATRKRTFPGLFRERERERELLDVNRKYSKILQPNLILLSRQCLNTMVFTMVLFPKIPKYIC